MPFEERKHWRDVVEKTAPGATSKHPGSEPDELPTIPPPRSSHVPELPPSVPPAAESFGKKYGWIVGMLITVAGVSVSGAVGVFAWQVAAMREERAVERKELFEKLEKIETKIDLGFRGEAESRQKVADRVLVLEVAAARTPVLSTNLNVARQAQ